MSSEFSTVLGSDEILQKPKSVFSYGKSYWIYLEEEDVSSWSKI